METITLTKKTLKKINNIRLQNESYDETILNMIHERNFYEIQEYTDNSAKDFEKELNRIFKIIKYEIPEDINIKGVMEIISSEDYESNAEKIIEVYCIIEDIFSPN